MVARGGVGECPLPARKKGPAFLAVSVEGKQKPLKKCSMARTVSARGDIYGKRNFQNSEKKKKTIQIKTAHLSRVRTPRF